MSEFRIAGVLRRAFGLFQAYPWLLLGLAGVMVALPHGVGLAIQQSGSPDTKALSWLPFTLYGLGNMLLQAAVVRVGLDTASREPVRLGAVLGTAARSFFPLIAISILFILAFGLAFILLVFPALMLMCRWFVVVPVQAAEGAGIIAAFGRSAKLTDGVRWRVFGLLLVVGVLGLIVSGVIAFIGGFAGGFFRMPWLTATGTAVATALSLLFNALCYAAAYFELRETREGVLSQELVSVFS